MSNEDGTVIHQAKQPGHETGNYSAPKTCPEAVGERPVSYLQATPPHMLLHPSTSSLYLSSTRELLRSRSSFDVASLQCLNART
eukprot:7622656-Ditylum_brightwellii.AAC.1